MSQDEANNQSDKELPPLSFKNKNQLTSVACEPPMYEFQPINNSRKNSESKLKYFFQYFKIKNTNFAFVILAASAFMQNVIVGGANNAILTTIEKAFYLTSLQSAFFLSSYDIANIIASPIIGFFGDRSTKHRIIAFSMVGLSLASIIMIIPGLALVQDTNTYQDNSTGIEHVKGSTVCTIIQNNSSFVSTTTISAATYSSSSNFVINNIKFIFYLANALNGVSSVGLYTITISYIENIFIDENVHLRQGIYYAVGAIGVGVGMLVTGNFLNLNADLRAMSSIKSNSNSVNFIGVSINFEKYLFGYKKVLRLIFF